MQTFDQWKTAETKRLSDKYNVPQCEIDFLDNWSWYRDHIQPLMRKGVSCPSNAVAKSLARHCPYSPQQLIREFASYGHGDNFWPTGVDLRGYVIQYAW